MMLSHEEIDDFVEDSGLDSFTAQDVADYYGATRHEASVGLQYHRRVQASGRARHTVVCRSYGRDALWMVASREGSHAAMYRHVGEGQPAYSARDCVNRFITDVEREIYPAILQGMAPAHRQIVVQATTHFTTGATSMVHQLFTTIEALVGADFSKVAEEKVYP